MFLKNKTIHEFTDRATRGRGFFVNGQRFVHHSPLSLDNSAAVSITRSQKLFVLGFLLVAALLFYVSWFYTLLTIVIVLTIFYFADLVFGLFLAYRSFTKSPEVSVSPEELAALPTGILPKYTIFCPLYKEWQILPQFVTAIQALDYPKNKLQVMLQLEEDDTETRARATAMQLPKYFKIVVVPQSMPKTKPKAMNYGLQFATGEIITIYDAEDVPDPLQLKKVVVAFMKSDPRVVCIQGKLNFYNPYQNLLTRMFTAEYSLWFDLILPGLQSLGAPIPLGGTSNHFRKDILHELAGWDAYNVTEDCDLGLRLAKRGFRTAIVDSTTLEEANSGYHNWYRQRSRWIKGYMQTYLVHMRDPRKSMKEFGLKNLLLLQLTVGGKVLSMFVNPLLWVVTFAYFAFRAQVAPYIEPLFPPVVLYIGVVSLFAGNFFYMYAYLIGLAKRREFGVMKYVFFVPFYWLAMSVAAWKALYELIVKPHYWQKTTHGLHLQSSEMSNSQFLISNEIPNTVPQISTSPLLRATFAEASDVAKAMSDEPKGKQGSEGQASLFPNQVEDRLYSRRGENAATVSILQDVSSDSSPKIGEVRRGMGLTSDSRLVTHDSVPSGKIKHFITSLWSKLGINHLPGGAWLLAAMIGANFLNFLFSAVLGRRISPTDFGTLTLFVTIIHLVGIVAGAIGGSVTYRIARLLGSKHPDGMQPFMQRVGKYSFMVGLVIAGLWAAVTPLVANFFHVTEPWMVLAFAPIFPIMISQAVWSGFLRGDFAFKLVAFGTLADPIIKLIVGALFVYAGRTDLAPMAVLVAVAAGWITLYFLGHSKLKVSSRNTVVSSQSIPTTDYRLPTTFPKQYFGAALLAGSSATLFLTADVLLVKHFFTPDMAGRYALLSLCGNMIFYLCSLPSVFVTTVVSRARGEGKDGREAFLPLFRLVMLAAVGGFVFAGLLGRYTMPLMFGSNALPILQYLPAYTAALGLLAVCSSYISYRIAKDDFRYAWFGIAGASLMAIGIWVRHGSIGEVAQVVLFAAGSIAALLVAFHAIARHGRFVFRNLIDFLDIFLPLPGSVIPSFAKAMAGKPVSTSESASAGRPESMYFHTGSQIARVRKAELVASGMTEGESKAKRILIFNWRDTRHVHAGGAEVYVHELAKRWVAEGNTVTLFCGSDGNSPRFENLDGVNIIRRGGFFMVWVWAFLYYMFRLRGKFDLVLDNDSALPFFTPLYVKEPVVCLMHHVHQEIFKEHLPWPASSFACWLENSVMPFLYRHTKFITVSNSTKVAMQELSIGRAGITVINPGVNMNELVPGEKDKDPLVVYVGRLNTYKSVDVLIRAFELLHITHPKARLVIAGSGEEEENLKALTTKLRLGKVVSFLGKVEEELKVFLMQQAWVFANPSSMEGWGITSIEANACGTPVVASNVPGLRDSVQNPHTGYLVEYGNPAAFAEKIDLLLTNHKQRHFMEQESLDWAKQFDWDTQAKRVYDYIS